MKKGSINRLISLAAVVAVASALAAVLYAEVAGADPPPQQPGPAQPVEEQNVDDLGLIRVHEQGTASVSIAGTPTVNVGNFPGTQPVSGTVDVGNFPATQQVAGTVNVGNLPAIQAVQDEGLPSANHFQDSVSPIIDPHVLFGPADPDTLLAITAVTFANTSEHSRTPTLQVVSGPWREGQECSSGGELPPQLLMVNVGGEDTQHLAFPDEPLVAASDAQWCLRVTGLGGPPSSVTIVGYTS